MNSNSVTQCAKDVVTSFAYKGPLAVLHWRIRQVSPERQIDLDTLGIDRGDVPADMRAMMSAAVFPEAAMNPFGMLAKRVRDHLVPRAHNSDIGWIMPPDAEKLLETEGFLQQVQEEFMAAHAAMLVDWDANKAELVEELAAKHAGHPHIAAITAAVTATQPSRSYVERNVTFEWGFVEVTVGEGDAVLSRLTRDGMISLRSGFFGDLLVEMTKAAKGMLGDIHKAGRGFATQTRRLTALKIPAKLQAVSFLDKRLAMLAEELRKDLDSLPRKGKLVDAEFRRFVSILEGFADQVELDRRITAIEARIGGAAVSGLPTQPTQPTQPVVEAGEAGEQDLSDSATDAVPDRSSSVMSPSAPGQMVFMM